MHYDSSMSTITVKDVSLSVHRALKSRAKAHGRSLNREIIATLEASLHSVPIDAAGIGKRAAAVRESMSIYLTPSELTALKHAGRR
jgi:plasmid stability protein